MNFIISHENLFVAGWLLTIFSLEQLKQRFFVPTGITNGGWQRWLKNGVVGILNRLLGPILILALSSSGGIKFLVLTIRLSEKPVGISV